MKKALIFIVVLIALWMLWIPLGRPDHWIDPDWSISVVEEIKSDTACTRNIVGIQPWMNTIDYLSEGHFYEKMRGYFDSAQHAGFFREGTVVLLPEYIGTWLVISGEKASLAEMGTINSAMTLMVLSHPVQFINFFFRYRTGEDDGIAATLFRLKAMEMARIYGEVFKELAASYKVTIAAGSIVLPGAIVENNEIKIQVDKSLYNTSFVFHPDGSIDPQPVRKSFPISSELPFIASYPIDSLATYNLPIGKTSVVVCADSWYPETYVQLEKHHVEIVLVNSFCSGSNTMAQPWQGYDGRDEPADVDMNDIRHLTEAQAWVKYALPGRVRSTVAIAGVNVFLRGNLWDLGSDGQPLFVVNKELLSQSAADKAGIWSICF